jgi:hypothetical protein
MTTSDPRDGLRTLRDLERPQQAVVVEDTARLAGLYCRDLRR